MPTNLSTSTYNARTYGRKLSAKRKQSIDTGSEPRKRRKSSEEPEEREVSTDVEEDSLSSSPLRTYGTPKRRPTAPLLAKDLSDIFQSFSPKPSPQATPTKLASRMLTRSKTDSSIDSTSSLLADRTPSLPIFLSSSPPKPSTSSVQEIRPPPVPLSTNTRTYAGKSRSFLVAIPAPSLDPLALDHEEDEYSARESYASLRSRWGVDNSEDDPYPSNLSPTRSDATSTPHGTPTKPARGKAKAQQEAQLRSQVILPNGMMNPLKSITELRSKGESRRFLDEVGYLFEGMDSSVGIGLRRASALEITTKLCDADFARKAKAADFLSRAWDVFREAGAGKGEDKILDTLLAFFVALVSRDPASLRDLAQHSEVTPPSPAAECSKAKSNQRQGLSVSSTLVDTLFNLLSAPLDPLSLVSTTSSQDKAKSEIELKKVGVGKKDRVLFQTIHDTIISKSSLFPAHTPISNPLLLLHALHTLPPALIPPKHFPALLSSLRLSLAPVLYPASTSAYLSWPDAARIIAFENVYYHLRLLDVYLLGQWGTEEAVDADADNTKEKRRKVRKENKTVLAKAREEWLAHGLVALGVCAELTSGVSARNCMEMTLRVLMSLTHADEAWGSKVVDSECALVFLLRIILGSGNGLRVVAVKKEGEYGTVNGKGKGKMKEEADEEPHGEETSENEDASTHALDTLCLALGLLTNLVQVVDETKDLLRETRLDPCCTLRKRACIRQCTCGSTSTGSISALDILVRLYHRHLPRSTPPTNGKGKIKIKAESPGPSLDPIPDTGDALFLRGHLAVLFGLLIRGSPENQTYILDALDGAAAAGRLVEHAREFVAFYAALGGEGAAAEAEGKVGRDVVAFLEGLRT
ncbi:hypothetical protein FPV67DRAFT_1620063 [Lyophyllum atratum]|nr:hypothetical protein FPV67DRAFT_1620063 [Lyophyllum atratum]